MTKSSTTFANMIKPPKSNTHECIVNWIWNFPNRLNWSEGGEWESDRKKCGSNSNKNKQNHRPFQTFFNSVQFGRWNAEMRYGKWLLYVFIYSIYAFLSNREKKNKKIVNYFESGLKIENRKYKKQKHFQIEFIQFSKFRKCLESRKFHSLIWCLSMSLCSYVEQICADVIDSTYDTVTKLTYINQYTVHREYFRSRFFHSFVWFPRHKK